MKNKYHAKPTEIDGIKFASKKEARRYAELKRLMSIGEIECLEMQVPFQLIPAQYVTEGKKKRCAERDIKYIADFVYVKDGKKIVEDVKGDKHSKAYDVFVIKRKLMRYFYGIEVQEI